MRHMIEKYLRSPQHKLTVTVIGVGGTGSQVLQGLARIHVALTKLDHPGLNVIAWDPDTVTEANAGRQMFSPIEIGMNKAVALITRINRFYKMNWMAAPKKWNRQNTKDTNIYITCTDTVKSRKDFVDKIDTPTVWKEEDQRRYYWIDCGNTRNTGQVWLSTLNEYECKSNDKSFVPALKSLYQIHGTPKEDKEQGPSCSVAEALLKQDLFINTTIANAATHLLWQMIRSIYIEHQGVFISLENGLRSVPAPIITQRRKIRSEGIALY
jgi:PRTRC genetic system ThiF family protein